MTTSSLSGNVLSPMIFLRCDLLEIAENSVNSSSHLRSLVKPRTTTLCYLRHAGYRGANVLRRYKLALPKTKPTTNRTRKRKNNTRAMSAAVPAIPPKPITAETIAITRNTLAQYSIRKTSSFFNGQGHLSSATSIPAISLPVSPTLGYCVRLCRSQHGSKDEKYESRKCISAFAEPASSHNIDIQKS